MDKPSRVHFKTTTKPKIKYCPLGHFSELWFMSRKPKPFLWVSEINISIDVDDTLVHKSLACPNSLAWAKETVSYTFYKEIAQLAAHAQLEKEHVKFHSKGALQS